MPPDEETHLDEFQDGMQSWGGDVVFGQNTLEAICQVCEWCFHSSIVAHCQPRKGPQLLPHMSEAPLPEI